MVTEEKKAPTAKTVGIGRSIYARSRRDQPLPYALLSNTDTFTPHLPTYAHIHTQTTSRTSFLPLSFTKRQLPHFLTDNPQPATSNKSTPNSLSLSPLVNSIVRKAIKARQKGGTAGETTPLFVAIHSAVVAVAEEE